MEVSCLRQEAPLPELLVKPRRLGQGRCQNAAQEQPFPGNSVFLVPLLASVSFLACSFARHVTLKPLTRPLTSPHTSVEAVPPCVQLQDGSCSALEQRTSPAVGHPSASVHAAHCRKTGAGDVGGSSPGFVWYTFLTSLVKHGTGRPLMLLPCAGGRC